MGGVFGKVFERQRRAGQIIENGLERVVEQRQPVLHAGIAAALAHRLVQEIVGRGGTELGHVAGAEAADGFRDQLEFRHRHQVEPAQWRFASLRLRIERADCLQRVAEEIKADRQVHAGRIEIENAAAHRVVARLAHRRGAGEAVELQPGHDARHANDVAGRDRQRVRRREVARRHALQRGVTRGEQHRGLVAALHAGEPRQRGHALRHHAGIRRHPVIGQTIPGREFHGQNIGPEEGERARQRRHALAVAADHAERDCRRVQPRRDGAREIGQHQALGAVGDLSERERPAGLQQCSGRCRLRTHVDSSSL